MATAELPFDVIPAQAGVREGSCAFCPGWSGMRVAITGASGLFGYGLVKVFQEVLSAFPLTHEEVDITQADQVQSALLRIKPEVVIHAAAIPNPDTCEEEPARAYAVNVHGTRTVVDAARRVGARVATISTDAVFDGHKNTPYTERDPTRPGTVYGRTKLRSEEITREERESWIFRVSVLFGPGKENFVDKGLKRIEAGETYPVATDQLGSATYTLDAARKIREVMEARRYGLYHVTNSGYCTRFELARRAAQLAGLDAAKVNGKPLDQMGRPAKRLAYSVMDGAALREAGFALLRPWEEALKDYIRGRQSA